MTTTNQIDTLLVHRSKIRLPAHGFATHPLQRMTLTGRRMSRVLPSAIIVARIASQVRQPSAPSAVLDDCEPRRTLPTGALASFLLIVLIISAAFACTRLPL